ncbi:cupin domain-containing protein [Streptacidiphilus rugosus]|uniref:cupin domain-containing protein n=1 Tax=Streptacidiphilus rugosus TaxID=405783 RepID=UPI00056583A3|nr:cupin domain-containing protein [Streptacidiphilus rugosus]
MNPGLIVASTAAPADVHGVHGAAGLTHWTCLARRTGLDGDWEAVEWACLPPGGVSGEHLHTRTEEVYLLLSGRGEISLDGRARPVAAGDLVLTGLGTRHGLRNTGTEPLEWLVIEMTAVPTRTPHTDPIGSAVVEDLRRNGPLDPRKVLTGPLRRIEVARLGAGHHSELVADGVEHTVFVTEGDGLAVAEAARVPLAPGTALTLPLGSDACLVAGRDGLEYVHAVLAVPAVVPSQERGAQP